MEKKIEHEFIASSKVIRYKMNTNTADVLATLIYKQDYWKSNAELVNHKGIKYFYISHSDIKEETCLGIQVIKRALKTLINEGLISSKRQGLGKPNLYYVNTPKVEAYIKNHEAEYKAWRLKIREQNKATPLIPSLIGENDTSGSIKLTSLEVSKSPTTKNKSTNNKITNNNTNRINAVEGEIDLFDNVDELTDAITNLKDDTSDEQESHSTLFDLLIKLLPASSSFRESTMDSILIDRICEYSLDANDIAFKILSNAKSINASKKDARFGNLFVGLEEKNIHRELILATA